MTRTNRAAFAADAMRMNTFAALIIHLQQLVKVMVTANIVSLTAPGFCKSCLSVARMIFVCRSVGASDVPVYNSVSKLDVHECLPSLFMRPVFAMNY